MNYRSLIISTVLGISSIAQSNTNETLIAESQHTRMSAVGKPQASDNNGLVITSWMRYFNKHNQGYEMNLVQVHCATGMFRLVESSVFNSLGQVTDSMLPNYNTNWSTPIPGSIGELIGPHFCRKVKVTNW
jgi:hypothetical protein